VGWRKRDEAIAVLDTDRAAYRREASSARPTS